ncbi:MAG: TolC family protein [Gemmatimonadota bacterium]
MRYRPILLFCALLVPGFPVLTAGQESSPAGGSAAREAREEFPQEIGDECPQQARDEYTLEALLRIGREQNPTLASLRAREGAMEAGKRASSRWANPELAFEWGTGDPRSGGASRSLSGFSASQKLENPLTRHFRLQGLQAGVDAAGEEIRSAALEVSYEIRLHFYRILYLQEVVELARLNEEALAEILGLIETRAEVGEVRELEAIRLRVEHMRARNEVEASRIELDQYRQHLNTFLGNVLPGAYSLAGAMTAEGEEPALDHLLEGVLPNHPLLVKAAREQEAAAGILREARWGWLPDPVLSGASRKEMDGDVRSFGVGLEIPLWNQSRAAADEGRRRVRQARYEHEALQMELEAQLLIHHNHLRLYRQTLRLFEDGLLEEARASMEIAETSYRQGEISFLDYLDARRTFHSVQMQRQQALYDWHVERAALERAAGGGTL